MYGICFKSCAGDRKLDASSQMLTPGGDRTLLTACPHSWWGYQVPSWALAVPSGGQGAAAGIKAPLGSAIRTLPTGSHLQIILRGMEPNCSLGKWPLKRDSLIATHSHSRRFWNDPSHAITITFIHGGVYPEEVLGGHLRI